ncbi:hypothetical protein ccbrp13_50340 [Ktedonobacteria bacterium brp13]|nr:hypothetical protein ccbrp13_50340 [Ktedonobacteria bacterium brp13]
MMGIDENDISNDDHKTDEAQDRLKRGQVVKGAGPVDHDGALNKYEDTHPYDSQGSTYDNLAKLLGVIHNLAPFKEDLLQEKN